MQLYLFNDTNADVLKKNRYFCHRKSEYKNILRMKTIVLSCGLLMIFFSNIRSEYRKGYYSLF